MPAPVPVDVPLLPPTLAAFAAGAMLLQWQPVLPPRAAWLGGAALAAALAVILRAWGAPRACSHIAVAIACGALDGGAGLRVRRLAGGSAARRCAAARVGGRGHRARRRRRRSAAEPPRAARASRFAVERIADPRRDRAVAPVARLVCAGGARAPTTRRRRTSRPASAGARRASEAAARHRQSPRLRRRGVAARERHARDRLRARRRTQSRASMRSPAARPTTCSGRAQSIRARILAALADARYAGVIVALTIGDQRAHSRSAVARVQPDGNRAPHQHLGAARHGVRHARRRTRVRARAGAACALTARIPARKVAAAVGRRRRDRLRAARRRAGAGGAHAADARGRGARARARATRHAPSWSGCGRSSPCSPGIRGRVSRPASGCRSAPSACCSTRASGRLCVTAAARRRARASRERCARPHAPRRVVTIGLVPGRSRCSSRSRSSSPVANALAIPVVTFAVVPLALCGDRRCRSTRRGTCAHAVFAALMMPLDALAAMPGRGLAAACAAGLGGRRRARRRCRARRAARRAGTRARR